MLGRRAVLGGGGLAVVAALGGRALLARRDPTMPDLPVIAIAADRDALVLHQGDGAADALLRAVRTAAPGRRIAAHAVAVLAPGGFARSGVLLDRTRGRTVIALLDQADAVVIEAQLGARGAQALTRQRHGERILLTARI